MAKVVTYETNLNTAKDLQELRRILAERGKRLRKSRVKIINGYVHYSGTMDNRVVHGGIAPKSLK